MEGYLGDTNFKQILTEELMVVAYDYNSQEPRFFTKLFAENRPGEYEYYDADVIGKDGKHTRERRDVALGTATGASSAAPTFFDPKTHVNGYNMRELQIDGGVICNNPSLYAYEFARLLLGKKKIRLLSLGTGEKKFTRFNSADDFTKITYMTKMSEFMMNMDVYTAHYKLQNLFKYTLG